MVAPLTSLLKKNAYHWNDQANLAFNNLKKALSEAQVLRLPNFKEEFVVEYDAFGSGVGMIL